MNERKINNAFARFSTMFSITVALGLMIHYFTIGEFVYWHIPTVIMAWVLGRVMYEPADTQQSDNHKKTHLKK